MRRAACEVAACGRTLAPTMPFSGVSVSGSSEARLICAGVRRSASALRACVIRARLVGGVSPVAVQMWEGSARIRSRCRRGEPSLSVTLSADKGGVSPVPGQMWSAVEPSPGADVVRG